ncbi:DUF4268 domain-containing protein [Planctomycetota bacterium]
MSTINSLASKYPAIAAEWHPTKNGNLTPTDVVAGSNRIVWWKCAKGPDHEWRAMPSSRTGNKKSGCPFCSGLKASVTNSLASLHPEIAAEWHPAKNGDLTPDKITYGSELNCWWLCPVDENHEWRATPNARTYMHSGCPFCTIAPRSRREITLAIELAEFLDFDLDRHRMSAGGKILDVDVLIPSHGLIIEYDGAYWHKDRSDRDSEKSRLLQRAGWRVIRVREKPLQGTGPNDVVVEPTDDKAMVDAVLRKIDSVCGIKLHGLSRYLMRQTLAKADLAEAYIAKLLTSDPDRDGSILRQRFWRQLLHCANARTRLHATISASKQRWIGTGAGRGGVVYRYTVMKHEAGVDLYIDRGEHLSDENKRIFEALAAAKSDIQGAFGGPLEWEQLEGKRACRIRKRITAGGYGNEEKWDYIHDAMVDAMIRLNLAIKQHLQKLWM